MVKKWDIYYADLNPTQGSEHNGIRPVLVISNNMVNRFAPVCTIIPFSSYKDGTKVYPTELYLTKKETGLEKNSILMLQQSRTIDVTRLCSPLVSSIVLESVKEKITLSINEYFDL